jgi:transketolase
VRAEFVQAVLDAADREPDLVFLSGDLGFLALESVRTRLGPRFVNAGVSEQNMVSVAAGLAHRGFKPIVYSIAPFAVLRPIEQIRNDVCMHGLSVKVVGNGGGYGYGIMGGTHHTLEDIALMRTMPGMRIHVPVTSPDVGAAVSTMLAESGPAYLRLNLAAKIDFAGDATYAPFRQVRRGEGAGGVIVCLGPLVGEVMKALGDATKPAPSVWSLAHFPFGKLPAALVEELESAKKCLVLEEHLAAGGAGEALAAALLGTLKTPLRFEHLFARGYPSGRYGSQRWHLEESSLAGESLAKALRDFCA